MDAESVKVRNFDNFWDNLVSAYCTKTVKTVVGAIMVT
ncbi:hypothetical protein TR2A62_1795 [Thalassobium sp. R2A62]|nr:hypothetical protein TR2A62_1795 [Thalassobium sp. R2A62]